MIGLMLGEMMAAPPTPWGQIAMESVANQAPRPRRHFTFTTVHLLFVSAFLVTFISHIFASRELHELKGLEKEVKKLRGELGYFKVDDPTKCYVICAPQVEKDTFTFRLYLPPGHNYVKRNNAELFDPTAVKDDGEFTFHIRVSSDQSGTIQIEEDGLSSSSNIPISRLGSDGSRTKLYYFPYPEHYQRLTEIKPGEPIRLIRVKITDFKNISENEEIDIWLENPSNPLNRKEEKKSVEVER